MYKLALVLVTLVCISALEMPTVKLGNAARKNVEMPVMGLGTGGYGACPTGNMTCASEPFCWWSSCCPDRDYDAVMSWFKLGGRRIDSANSYYNQPSLARAIKDSGLERHEFFITSKLGPSLPLGFNDTLNQINDTLINLDLEYVDLLLVHWPVFHYDPHSELQVNPSTDPYCRNGSDVYNVYKCIESTWKAMEIIFKDGRARAIGVSNHNTTHIEYILNHSDFHPSVSQNPYNPYLSHIQNDLVEFCEHHGIHYQGYSPLGVPDYHQYVPPMATYLLEDPTVLSVSEKHNVTAAQVLLQWSIFDRKISVNPRASNPAHQQENLDIFVNRFELDKEDVEALDKRPQDWCKYYETVWYECNGTHLNPGNQ